MTPSPYAALLGLSVEEGAGAPVLVMPFASDLAGRPGFLQGGAIGGLLEAAALAAVADALGTAGTVEAVTVTIDYMRGGREKVTRAQGRVVRLGTRIANVEAIAWQDDAAQLVAAARMTCLVVRAAGSA